MTTTQLRQHRHISTQQYHIPSTDKLITITATCVHSPNITSHQEISRSTDQHIISLQQQ